jgi:hypothetical protein
MIQIRPIRIMFGAALDHANGYGPLASLSMALPRGSIAATRSMTRRDRPAAFMPALGSHRPGLPAGGRPTLGPYPAEARSGHPEKRELMAERAEGQTTDGTVVEGNTDHRIGAAPTGCRSE